MQYLLLIYAEEENIERLLAEDYEGVMSGYRQVNDELKRAGAWVAADRLERIDTATTVRVREGKAAVTDGPFAETAEQLGGYYMIEAPDLDAAIAWATKLPAARYGSVEVRPVMAFNVADTEP